ncbi:hypothetical protein B0T20DRAFT_409663 [Sordaria brevicollis]|uniref:Secreted protein n=1 Tax=Sordaria brevicollis TaxID=83679 RepID=A0AAE0PFZ7_SORBR|nr:hypothetical protein B0T20DRAFT_409663 [Sordaria brevicollis]
MCICRVSVIFLFGTVSGGQTVVDCSVVCGIVVPYRTVCVSLYIVCVYTTRDVTMGSAVGVKKPFHEKAMNL